MKVSNEKGAAIVEFALVVPLLLLLIFGMIEFSLLLYNKHMLTNASREGARRGIVKTGLSEARVTKGEIEQVINDYCAGRLITFGENENPTVTCFLNGVETEDLTGADFPDTLVVTASYNYNFLLIQALMDTLDETMGISGKTTMKYE